MESLSSSDIVIALPALTLCFQKGRLADEPDAVAIGVLDVHFSRAPCLVKRSGVDWDAFRDEFCVQGIHTR
jgi:hypothetical protein